MDQLHFLCGQELENSDCVVVYWLQWHKETIVQFLLNCRFIEMKSFWTGAGTGALPGRVEVQINMDLIACN